MLFPKKRARQDTGTSISYLMKRVRDTDQISWMNMVHLFNYVRGTKDLPLIISAYKSGMIKWYIDGSYVVRPNMRVRTGRGLKMGRGYPICLLNADIGNPRPIVSPLPV